MDQNTKIIICVLIICVVIAAQVLLKKQQVLLIIAALAAGVVLLFITRKWMLYIAGLVLGLIVGVISPLIDYRMRRAVRNGNSLSLLKYTAIIMADCSLLFMMIAVIYPDIQFDFFG